MASPARQSTCGHAVDADGTSCGRYRAVHRAPVRTVARRNPRIGLRLYAIFDKLFDQGLMTFDDDFSVIVIDWPDQC